MPGNEIRLSEYQIMWLFAMFDLPVDTKEARREYVRFRNLLLDQGFSQLQYSVYARCCDSEETADRFRERLRRKLPADGHIRLLGVTDRQFGKMEAYCGKTRVESEKVPEQLQLF